MIYRGWLFYAITKDISKFSVERLGQTGDFLNTVTSLGALITVILVYKSFSLQKQELSATRQQIKEQKESLEEEEKVNRTARLIDNWLSIKDDLRQRKETIKEDTIFDYLNKINFIYCQNNYQAKIDYNLLSKFIVKDESFQIIYINNSSRQTEINRLKLQLNNTFQHIQELEEAKNQCKQKAIDELQLTGERSYNAMLTVVKAETDCISSRHQHNQNQRNKEYWNTPNINYYNDYLYNKHNLNNAQNYKYNLEKEIFTIEQQKLKTINILKDLRLDQHMESTFGFE